MGTLFHELQFPRATIDKLHDRAIGSRRLIGPNSGLSSLVRSVVIQSHGDDFL